MLGQSGACGRLWGMLTAMSDESSVHAKRYPDEVKELAYQLWAFVCSRDCKKTYEALLSGDNGDPVDVSYQAIAYWAREYGWADRATRDVQSIAPDLRHQAFSELLFAGLDGARYIRRVNAGKEQPDKVRAMLAVAAVDRIGFSPVGKGMPAIEAPTTTTTRRTYTKEELAKMTPDELMRAELEYRSGK